MSRFIEVFNLTGARMEERGNFFALMFLVLGLGALVVYFVLGWSSNVVAQVSNTSTLTKKSHLNFQLTSSLIRLSTRNIAGKWSMTC